jgi:glucose/arabinose dehydrogenase/mono/diheme cytochrome c family protein
MIPPSNLIARPRPLVPNALAFVVLFVALCGFPVIAAESAPSKTPRAKAPKAAKAPRPPSGPPLAPWVEPDFPFFSSVLDARKAGAALPANNLTPRGIILNLGHDCWACFDPDLLRVSAVWRGPGVSPRALAPGSYVEAGQKTPGGQTPAPEPTGNIWLASGIYPGWQAGDQLLLEDPREPAPSPEEIGRGPVSEEMGRFDALRLVRGGVVLEYTAGGAKVRDWTTVTEQNGHPVIERHLNIGASSKPSRIVLGTKSAETTISLGLAPRDQSIVQLAEEKSVWTVRIAPHAQPVPLVIALTTGGTPVSVTPRILPTETPAPRWPQEVTTSVKRSTATDAYVVDTIALPIENPWRRGVRPSDIQFLKDGTGVSITLDGDVWLVRGLHDDAGKPRWKRFTSGLHEPMSVAIRNDEIFAFDKNGIWRLRDTNNDGEADVHEMFSNAFAQTADMREFPSQIRLAPGGEFIISKGGQQATYQGKHNGSVLRISADGRRSTVLGYGFRQPNIGVNIRTGLVTSSDQQGQYIPSTPLHIVRDRQFYGFLPPFAPKEVYPSPPAEPLTWIPHPINASAISQVWLFGAKMGPLNDELVHIGFNKPELFHVLMNNRGKRPQASIVSVTRAFDFPPLNGSVNPVDGQLYLAGFQVLGWGNILDTPAGMGRVRYTGAPVTLPREIVPMDKGVLVRFDVTLDPKKARDPASYSLQSWSYQRTYKYGSPQYKADGTPGQDALTASSAYLSKDGRSVFIGVPDMKPVMQLRIGWSLATVDGKSFDDNAYTTPYEVVKFDPQAEGFGNIQVDLSPRAVIAQASGPVTVEEGQRLAQLFACVACHAADSAGLAKAGPSWKGLFGSERPVVAAGKPTTVKADEAYLRESILDPTSKIAAGFEKGEYAMPSYAGVVTDSQVEALVLYIKSLAK